MLTKVCRLDERHALAGLFGEPARERVIASRAAEVLEEAATILRLAAFAETLRRLAWDGVPMAMHRCTGGWSEWTFADGSSWRVRHTGRHPRRRRRVIVAGTTASRQGVEVDAYGAGGAYPETTVQVTDAVSAG